MQRTARELSDAFSRVQDGDDLQYLCGVVAELGLLLAPFTETHLTLSASIARLARVRGTR